MFEPDRRWEAFAAREPYFAILSAPRFLRANLTAAGEREFFASGETLVDAMLRTIELRLQPEFAPMSILEYGCGVGRLAIPFARRAASVVAVDRSPVMLEIAQREAHARGIDHIAFLPPENLFDPPRKVDLLSCYLVLQRMPPHEGLALLRRLLTLLGTGGVGVFHVPYRATSGWLRTATRSVRAHVPGANAVANLLLGKPLADPLASIHTYALEEVTQLFEEASIHGTYVVLDHHEGLEAATLYLQVPPAQYLQVPPAQTAAHDRPLAIDVKQLIANASIEDMNRQAEEYFASLTDWDHHLAKPFAHPDETPALLMDVVGLLQGLRPAPGMTVLECGAGTGWLSRFLTQLGCRAILVDVAPTALQIARELYARQPVIGDRPAPEFLLFDGRHIDLPDASVDRVVMYHALHHASDPAALLAELARVLTPGGIAGFAEPGPRHSQSPMSQFEMRTYGVIENDIDVHAIWRAAESCGFRDMKLAVFHAPSFHVSLAEYEDLLAGGATSERWLLSTRGFLRHVRTFFLYKHGDEALDSRSGKGLSAGIRAALVTTAGDLDQPVEIDATVSNTGDALWLPSTAASGGVWLGAHVYDAEGALLTFDAARQPLTEDARTIGPGESVQVRLSMPSLPAGHYVIELDCVADGVTWFAQVQSKKSQMQKSQILRLQIDD